MKISQCISLTIAAVALLSCWNVYWVFDKYIFYEVTMEKSEIELDVLQSSSSSSSLPLPLPATTTTASFQRPAAAAIKEEHEHKRACRVIIENKVDYHHEVIESAVLRFPLPLDKFNCSKTKPVIYDFSLFQNRWPNTIGEWIPTIPKPNYLNETEFWGWKSYFEEKLQGKSFQRTDGRLAYYNKLVSYNEYENSPIDAIIGLTCSEGDFPRYIGRDDGTYCILHSYMNNTRQQHNPRIPAALKKSCFLVPSMWPGNQCTFLPTDLPKINLDKTSKDPSEMKICLFGTGKNDAEFASLFSKVPYNEYNAKFYIGARYPTNTFHGSILRSTFMLENSIANRTVIVHEKDFLEFAKFQASCDILLPKTTPSSRPAFFHSSVTGSEALRKMTGNIPVIVAYKIPSVMHVELERIYHSHFTAPVMVYNDTMESKVAALRNMMVQVAKEKEKEVG